MWLKWPPTPPPHSRMVLKRNDIRKIGISIRTSSLTLSMSHFNLSNTNCRLKWCKEWVQFLQSLLLAINYLQPLLLVSSFWQSLLVVNICWFIISEQCLTVLNCVDSLYLQKINIQKWSFIIFGNRAMGQYST